MLLKWIGAIFVIFSASFLGYYFSLRDKYRLSDLEEVKRFLTVLEGEISYMAVSLPEAFFACAKRSTGAIAVILEDMAQRLLRRYGNTAGEIWETVLIEHIEETYLKPEDLQILTAFGRTLGYLDQAQQRKQIQLTISTIEATQEQLRQTYEKTGKVTRNLGVLFGILLAVLLL